MKNSKNKKAGMKTFPRVFMDISVNDSKMGRIEFELFADTPLTSENFRCLCTGEKGRGLSGKQLHYEYTKIHRIVPGMFIQGGDITKENGTGGESIYGEFFEDENFIHKHDKPFVLAMSNNGAKNSNSSQFYITLTETEWMDDMSVVFGKVVSGFDTLKKLSKSESGDKILIYHCG